MYSLVIGIHVVISTLLLVIAVTRLFRSITGWIRPIRYIKTDSLLSFSFLILLYLQLFSGILLYFFFRNAKQAAMTVEEAIHNENMRFWAIEHFSLMIFSLIVMQTGQYFINHASSDRLKFKQTTLYVGFVLIMVLISLGLAYL